MSGVAYVYILFRPDGRPCYVGKGSRNRWLEHDRYAYDYSPINPHLRNIIKKAGGELPKVKLCEGLSDDEALSIEIAFINAIGRIKNGGPLVNLTDGGEGGLAGYAHSAESKAAIGAKHRGKIVSKIAREKMSKAARARGHNGKRGPIEENRREAIRIAVTAFWARRRIEAKARGGKLKRLGSEKE